MSTTARQPAMLPVDDPLIYLPRKTVSQYGRGQAIYDENHPVTGLYMVVQGRVKVCSPMEDGSQIVSGLFHSNQFFGECALLGPRSCNDRATALDNTALMMWPAMEIEDQIQRQPKLGIALIQMLVERCVDYEERLQSLALQKTPERVAASLLRFAQRMGTRADDGTMRIPPLTHQLISEYVGTSREIVTFQMSQLRQRGLLRYSRKGIDVYPEALTQHLQK